MKFELTGNPLAGAKHLTHLLSGLVTCGACNSPLATTAVRWRCKGDRTGTCDNGLLTSILLEARAPAGVLDRLLLPALIRRFAALLQQERTAAALAGNAERVTAENELAETCAPIAKLVTRIDEGGPPRALTTRVKDLEAEERRLEEIIASTPVSKVVRLPADYESLYTRTYGTRRTPASDDGANARQVIRPLIEDSDAAGQRARRQALPNPVAWRFVPDAGFRGGCVCAERKKPPSAGAAGVWVFGCGDRI